MTDVPGFNPVQEISLIEADFANADEAYDYLNARLHFPEQFEHTPDSLRECLLTVGQQSYVMISRSDPRHDWFTPLCEALEAASCENDMLVVMHTFTIV